MSRDMQHIMIDNETLGTRADSVIISIGAVKFNPRTGEIDNSGFYTSISIDSNTDAGRHIDESTIIWWMKQSAEAQKVFSEPKVVLSAALDDFADFFDHGNYQVWSNGADFDIPMLAHAFHTHGLSAPWKFYNTNCLRTIGKLDACKNTVKISNPAKHNALVDAHTQALQLHEYFKSMKAAA